MATSENSSMEGIKDITFGSIAGMTSKIFEHPFDLIKVRLQSQPTDGQLQFKGPLDCFQQTWGREGWKGLYRGVSAPLVGAACENASLFLVYNKAQDLIRSFDASRGITPNEEDNSAVLTEKQMGKKRELGLGELAIAAGGAGAAASFILMQVQMMARDGLLDAAKTSALLKATPSPSSSQSLGTTSSRPYSTTSQTPSHPLKPPIPNLSPKSLPPLQGPFALVRSTVRQNGIRGLWLGQMGTLFRETGGSSAWFTAYETVSRSILSYRQNQLPSTSPRLTKKDLKTWELMASGACAGMSYNIILFPADSIKSAMQTESELRPRYTISPVTGEKVSIKPKFWKVGKEIWQKRGLKGLYAGCGITVARAAPSSAMIFLIYESLESRFGEYFT